MANFNLENYIPVNERLALFYRDFPNGRIITLVAEHNLESGFVMFKACAYREKDDVEPSATGHAFEERTQGYVNKTSYIENCETSAVGRALALLGYEISKGIASREEMAKVQRYDANAASGKAANVSTALPTKDMLIETIKELAAAKNIPLKDIAYGTTKRTNNVGELTLAEAEKALTFLRRK